ncbi:MAG: DNA ligase D [Rhodocyclaceae bacterium]|nr:DNA ligase D [Rhodocyclaceae bacterium]
MAAAKPPDALVAYRGKRNFDATPEPPGGAAGGRGGPAFIVQRHAARRLHYDFRLELDGVLRSWAVPRGPSLDPAEKRLAVEVEDHPLEYGDFEGTIPAGHYGAGEVQLWDRGTWQAEDAEPAAALAAGRLKFSLQGFKLRGRWMLVRMAQHEGGDDDGHGGEARRNWLLIKEKDGAARRGTAAEVTACLPGSVKQRSAAPAVGSGPLPAFIAPQLATLTSAPPEQAGWIYEIKYDGYRILARLADGRARLFTRAGNDWTPKLAPLARRLERLRLDDSWLDGEIVVLDPRGIPDFQALQNAFERRTAAGIVYYIFDAPWLAGHDLRTLPLIERKERLAAALAAGGDDGALAYSAHFAGAPGEAAAALKQACRLGLEGLVGKRGDAPYVSERSRSWIKLKCRPRQEFVVGGYTDPRGSRTGFGALLLGLHDAAGKLRYVGRVGSGFDEALLARLTPRLAALRSSAVPFAAAPQESDAHWVRPQLVAEVAYSAWTRDKLLRQASFIGLREDKPASTVTGETMQAATNGQVASGRRDARVGGVRISHPERLVWPDGGITKSDLAHYYESVGPWLLPHLRRRPLSLLRCPDGSAAECFFQKHLDRQRPVGVLEFAWDKISGGKRDYMYVDSIAAVVGLVQYGAVEFHTWGARLPDPARPDRITLDLDPAPDVPWPRIVEGAQLARTALAALGLACFVKTTGGKGLHLVAPLERRHGWDEVKAFAKAIAEHLARVLPDRFTANMAKSKRAGRIFIDYLRNEEGATAVAAYSTRARPGAPVSTPLRWEELTPALNPADWTLLTIPARVDAMREDPWLGYDEQARRITAAMRRALGMAA